MKYKLEHKTIGFGIDPSTRQPTRGIEGVFFIPSYQRGYRWTADEVTKLLDDIWESAGQPYSLQPIVVQKKRDGSSDWALIDGQQRLTTLWLLLRFMQKGDVRYTLEYATRPGSQAYLHQIDPAQAEQNIDYFHIYQAHVTITDWFTQKMGAAYKQFLVDEMFRLLSTSVRVIWYEIPEDDQPIPLFTRLNQGRIPLTDAELIKAVLLTHVEQEISGRETEVAAQWDGIERDLQRDEIWAFAAGPNRHSAGQQGTRIDLLLDTLANKPSGGARRYHTFDALQEKARTQGLAFWDDVVALHAQILGWFEEPRLYNKIGFLVACGTPIGSILGWAQGAGGQAAPAKSAFETLLNHRIRTAIQVDINDTLDVLHYESRADYEKLQRILLLFNIATCRGRFPFEHHVGHSWTLEHIHAQSAQKLNRVEQWDSWLQAHRKALETIQTEQNKGVIKPLLASIDAALPTVHTRQFDQEQFNALASDIMMALNDGVVEEADHSLSNLALLQPGANAALSNAVFEVKRQRVLDLDKSGDYVPAATRNVFLKYYTPAERLQPHFWGDEDKTAYLAHIKTTLTSYLQ
ncbi:DUF262 domain-containing protein [Hydrogenophaga sp.]|uniref:DUF262 domain-containing protein n=1 Tax=Hydrogenophaga sp. TaxID=1904254 RepID=UPI0035B17DAC